MDLNQQDCSYQGEALNVLTELLGLWSKWPLFENGWNFKKKQEKKCWKSLHIEPTHKVYIIYFAYSKVLNSLHLVYALSGGPTFYQTDLLPEKLKHGPFTTLDKQIWLTDVLTPFSLVKYNYFTVSQRSLVCSSRFLFKPSTNFNLY